MDFDRLLLVLLVATWVAGCSSTDPLTGAEEPPESVIRFESGRILLDTGPGGPRVSVEVEFGCPGLPCEPESGTLTFVSRRPPSRYEDDHTVTISAGGIRLAYPGAAYESPAYERRDLSERVTVPVSADEFRQIARADTVHGQLGSTSWTMPYERRRALRSMVRQVGS